MSSGLDELFAWMPTDDLMRACTIVGGCGKNLFKPDETIAPDGKPYIYRWHLARGDWGNDYFHLQVKSDPERPLHDHPWDNWSVIVAGGYDEAWLSPDYGGWPMVREFRKGDCIARKADEMHRLMLPEDITYTMTRFSTGPKLREWGFWTEEGWVHNKDFALLRVPR